MFDSASRNNRHVFGVNIRYFYDGKVRERVLGVLTQRNRQFGTVLSAQVRFLLAKIGKTIEDVYVSCTDNGANMVKTSDLILAAQKDLNLIQLFSDEDIFIDHDSIIQEALLINDTIPNDELIAEEDDCTEPVINIWEQSLGSLGSLARCGAHCLQLASGKVTKRFDQFINPLRQFIKQSRLAENKHIFLNLNRPSEDNFTRWSSTFRMVNEFLEHKEKYEAIQHPAFQLNENIWLFVDEFHACFKHVDKSILYFQAEEHTMSECYIQWMRMEAYIAICDEGTFGIRDAILPKLKVQSNRFLDCDAMVSNLIYDPRIEWKYDGPVYNFALFKRGFDNIMKVLISLEGHDTEQNHNAMSEGDSLLRELLGFVPSTRPNVESFKLTLTEFAFQGKKIGIDEDFKMYDFWHKLRHSEKYNLMAKLGKVILSAPFTQVPVERTFSVFALTLTHLRTCIGDDVLNAILVARQNSDLIDKINFI